MHLTIAICTYNNAKLLADTLASLGSLEVDPEIDYQVLVVNNNCTDETDLVLSTYGEKIDRLTTVHESRQGLSYARNRALSEAEGDYVCFLDDDVVVDPEWLNGVATAFKRYQADIVGGKSYLILPCDRPAWFYPELEILLSKLDYGSQPLIGTDKELFGLNFAVKKQTALMLGGFKDNLGRKGNLLLSGEEKEFQKRVIAGGGKCVYQPEAVVGHVVPLGRMKKKWFLKRIFYGELGARLTGEVHDPLFPTLVQTIKCILGLIKSIIIRDCDAAQFFHKQMVTAIYAGRVISHLRGPVSHPLSTSR
ncbi:MAG: glycosyltransferase family 2 protein [Desulfobulbaceae bacterium]|nr:glycosyltransferase family 2 protein [Desulfobulbaceae bacterium]